jgi:hypothetical protein
MSALPSLAHRFFTPDGQPEANCASENSRVRYCLADILSAD